MTPFASAAKQISDATGCPLDAVASELQFLLEDCELHLVLAAEIAAYFIATRVPPSELRCVVPCALHALGHVHYVPFFSLAMTARAHS